MGDMVRLCLQLPLPSNFPGHVLSEVRTLELINELLKTFAGPVAPFPTNSITFRRQLTSDSPVFSLLKPDSHIQPNRRPAASSKGAAKQTFRMSWSQSKSRTCGGALPSGNIANSAEDALPFKCARILSITAGSSMQRFDASTMILTCPAQRSQVSMGPPPDRC
jgi:hypothetical protein